MTPTSEQLEERLQRVLGDAARQLPVQVPAAAASEVAASASRRGRRRDNGIRPRMIPSGGAVAAAIAVLIALGIGVGAITLLHHRAPSPGQPASIGNAATKGGLSGSQAALVARIRSLRGQPVVITVWASWCSPCTQDLRAAEIASDKYGRNVAFVGIDTQDQKSNVQRFLRTNPLPFATFQGKIQPLLHGVHLRGLPTTIFLSRTGHVIAQHVGEYFSPNGLDQDIVRAFGSVSSSSAPLLNTLSVLRQPQSSRDLDPTVLRLAEHGALFSEPGRAIIPLIRLAAVTPWGAKVFLIPVAPSPTKPGSSAGKASHRLVQEGQADLLGELDLTSGGGGGTCCATAAALKQYGVGSWGGSPGSLHHAVLIVPNGVAKVAILLRPPQQHQHSSGIRLITVRAIVRHNVAAFQYNRAIGGDPFKDMIWYGPSGAEIKRLPHGG